MNASIGSWMLAGALLASLGWNAALVTREGGGEGAGGTREPAATSGSCADAVERLGDLGLPDERREELREVLARCDAEGTRLEARASALSRELQQALRDLAVDPAAVRARAQELGEVRAAAVSHCVESSLELRRLLTPSQLDRLLEACCGESCETSCGE